MGGSLATSGILSNVVYIFKLWPLSPGLHIIMGYSHLWCTCDTEPAAAPTDMDTEERAAQLTYNPIQGIEDCSIISNLLVDINFSSLTKV